MSHSPHPDQPLVPASAPTSTLSKPQDSYVKLAMRNMVRKSGTSLQHFALTILGLLAAIISLAYFFR